MCRGDAGMGYCPFSVLGSDIPLVSRQAGCRRVPGCTRAGATWPGLRIGASGSASATRLLMRATWFFLAPGRRGSRHRSYVLTKRRHSDQFWVAT